MATPVWGKDKDKKWRRTFTRDNKLGERKLAFDLRHKSAGDVMRAMKARDMEKESKADFETRRLGKLMAIDAIPRPEMPKAGLEIVSLTSTPRFKIPNLFCLIGLHKWNGQHAANAYERKYFKVCELCRKYGPEVKSGW